MSYRKTEICEPIIAANRHHCHIPAEAWEVDAATVCGVCQAKNANLVAALLQKIPVDASSAAAVAVKTPVVSIHQQRCKKCGFVKIFSSRWERGERLCVECKQRRTAASTKKMWA